MNRRELLKYALASGVGIAATHLFDVYNTRSSAKTKGSKYSIPGRIFLLGQQGGRYPNGQVDRPNSRSVLTEVSGTTGDVKQTPVPMGSGHYIMPLYGERLFLISIQGHTALVVDEKHNIQHTLTAPKDQVWAGHALYFAKVRAVVVPTISEVPSKAPGQLLFFDPDTFELKDSVAIAGNNPHDMKPLPGSDHVLVMAYGRFNPNQLTADQGSDPIIAFIDLEQKKVIKEERQFQLLGINHLALDKNQNVYSSQLSLAPTSEETVTALRQKYPNDHWPWGDSSGNGLDGIPLPAPLLFFPKNGEPRELFAKPGAFLRNQDIVYSETLDMVYSTFSESNTIVRVDAQQNVDVFPAGPLRIQKIRGIRTIPNSPHLIANDSEYGFSIFHGETFELLRHFPARLYLSRHLTLI